MNTDRQAESTLAQELLSIHINLQKEESKIEKYIILFFFQKALPLLLS